jgi:hypothetical protein
VAVGRSILIIIWHLLSDPTVRYQDLGSGFYDTRINAERRKRNHIRQLGALGYKVTLEPCRLTTTIPTRTRLAALRRRLPPAYAPSIFGLVAAERLAVIGAAAGRLERLHPLVGGRVVGH